MFYIKEEKTPEGVNYTTRFRNVSKLILFGLRELTDEEDRERVDLLLAENQIKSEESHPRKIAFSQQDSDLVISGLYKAAERVTELTSYNMVADSNAGMGASLLGMNAAIASTKAKFIAEGLEERRFPLAVVHV